MSHVRIFGEEWARETPAPDPSTIPPCIICGAPGQTCTSHPSSTGSHPMGTHSPALVVTETIIEKVYPQGAKTPSKIQRFVRGQIVSTAQVEAYKERTGQDVPTTDVQPGINAYLGQVVALDEEHAAPPVIPAPHVTSGPVSGPGVTSTIPAADEPDEVVEPADEPDEVVEPEAEEAAL